MRLIDYKLFSSDERLKYLRSQKMTTGIPYFGGKSRIGKYIYNTILNMAVTMYDNGDEPRIFIDAFTGGGKMGLSMPDGWFDCIVMNDLDTGVYSYYKCCKENYRLLLATVNRLLDNMNEDLFHVCTEIREEKDLNEYMKGAMTYLACALAYNNTVGSNYKLTLGDANEKEELKKIRSRANRTITKVSKQLNRRNYIIENLDYAELINKYTGKSWRDTAGKEHAGIKEYLDNKNRVLWYLDPPYYQETLSLGKVAPYTHTFDTKATKKMTKILATNKDLVYFIKSDYDPKEILQKEAGKLDKDKETLYEMENIFNDIEKEDKGFQKICVGGFDKGVILKDGEKSRGMEYIWTKGLPKDYTKLRKEYDLK